MHRKLWERFEHSLTGGAVIIGLASVASRILGLVRDNLFAQKFGATAVLDTYNAAFKIPDFIFNMLVLGALFAAFVPVFIEYWHQNHNESWRLVQSIFNLLLLGLFIFGGVAYFFAEEIMQLLVGAWSAELQQQSASLMRIMLISMIFFGASNVLSGILNSFRKFTAYALAPILYNLGIIIGIVFFEDQFGPLGLAYGVVLGALLHFLVQIPGAYKVGFRWKPTVSWSHPGVKKILKLMAPRSFALGITQFNLLIVTGIIAARLSEGSLTIWSWADNLQHFPINVFGVSLALSAFPIFSQAFVQKNNVMFVKIFSESFRRILFCIIPMSVAILLLRAQIVRLILGLGHGAFGWDATEQTAQTLGFFSISLFAQASIPLLARAFFAQQDTKTPVMTSIISVIINTVLSLWLVQSLGLYGIALAFSIAALVNMLMLLATLRIRIGDIDDAHIIRSALKIACASLLMGFIIQGAKYSIAPLVDMRTYFGLLTQTSLSVFVGGITYLIIAFAWKFPEVEKLKVWFAKI
ncbi:MAG: murein biosynthesis integral membrane protein MurJ [Candidatus Kerfeldbacteria bacterium RIFCSPHIGHO2_02_FULL_42_14]|uniref:Probable lipid II flippase MurJ n=1 Tax=Candidatus Kerfeldbacteria bacterium RIFCSPHIGHO2_02_FULL_42_14 TaxID=1798540 RepID=A0A1G2AP56_9BACT|nr:MAG: murein biosynthesis integral membrane protein MurJ [Candidatus Kerfeldbacteria bacterium RIFCSPHIGHO2_02_FULL_42_14]OGY81059.1 MAG: murein biosynthesis integral membrane protein MurJ [Candidatus Kerfeldbacteria bacterium RIFCSPHIGHO2_12_FULL_42_13]OGY84877.1 MAG: murein biosynthesis integral membrane protein MurJ [Candidatus Kerfeldbacteria bacterium RIFCSPLOWO2_02_FULL_42_19]OGY86790.1 MAG: murein biosynthesis integral membrane protein MurJ [Candidatus Kerfeldbacteria bacterium RIFCSPLO